MQQKNYHYHVFLTNKGRFFSLTGFCLFSNSCHLFFYFIVVDIFLCLLYFQACSSYPFDILIFFALLFSQSFCLSRIEMNGSDTDQIKVLELRQKT